LIGESHEVPPILMDIRLMQVALVMNCLDEAIGGSRAMRKVEEKRETTAKRVVRLNGAPGKDSPRRVPVL